MRVFKTCLVTGIASLALGAAVARAAQTPLTLTAGSYTQDMVVEATAANDATTHFSTNVTATMDGGTAKNGGVWYETGLTGSGGGGIPAAGNVTAADNASTTFSLRPYNGNNAILLDGTATTATLTLTTPTRYSDLAFLMSTGAGTGTIGVTLNFTDATTQSLGNLTSPDWFSNTPIAINANGRVTASNGAFDSVGTGNPRLYDIQATGVNGTKTLSSISLTSTGGGHTSLFAVSGTVAPEPASLSLLALAATGLLARRRRIRIA